ncbi:uridine nucleosidase [Phellopilus nigrolimitatus]|nr:uridine nucleosidase [Phellopilus nigrolimitatus]
MGDSENLKRIWLDCDPGHDDATAILLAIHIPGLELVGVSTVHGNTDADNTFKNALRSLYAFAGAPDVLVHAGAAAPLLKPAKHDPEIHGADGLGGVEGLPGADHPPIRTRREHSAGLRAVEGLARGVRDAVKDGRTLTVVSTGPMTNIALFVSVYPDLLDGVEEFVFMGGGVGLGNRSAVAEYNILCDPEAAQIVLNAPVKKTMVPINVTHTAIVTHAIHSTLLDPSSSAPLPAARTPLRLTRSMLLDPSASVHRPSSSAPLPAARTPLRHTLSTLLGFFAASYASTFGFAAGPPLHDALAVAYAARPALFACTRRRVDVELAGAHTAGETVVDLWGYRPCDASWGRDGRNCQVAERVDVDGFFRLFLECVERCDAVSPLNEQ